MTETKRVRPLVLCILDGFGERSESDANAVRLADTPVLNKLREDHPCTTLAASGESVGLPAGQMGNGEVGHRTLGAGRQVPSNRSRIDKAIRKEKFGSLHAIDQTARICLYDECTLHLMGLLSDGGVHSHIEHLFALLDLADFHKIPVRIHAFLDGRDTPPRSAMNYIRALQDHMENKDASLATLSGRHYAMDCDERWDRVYTTYHAMVRNKVLGPDAERAETPYDAVSRAYMHDLNDEFIVPVRLGDYQGFKGDFMCDFACEEPIWGWNGEDCGLAFNFRGDRMRQLASMLSRQGLPDEVANDMLMDRDKPMYAFQQHMFATMTTYADGLDVPVAFPKQPITSTLGEVVADLGLKQLRCAESEKHPHVTSYFSGGREESFAGESRTLIRSPRRVDTYDEKPEMSARKVADAVVEAIKGGEQDLIVVNFANPDMVGHTGKLEATKAALVAVDTAVGRIVEALGDAGGALLLTADHGNCESMEDDEGEPHTAHTDNPVPLIYVDPNKRDVGLRNGGSLADVAPTLLDIMGIEQPEAMTGQSLRVLKA